MDNKLIAPDYIFESSWEVCNKIGGIYTVLSTRAKTLQKKFHDKVFFIGPDLCKGNPNPLFTECDNLCKSWREHAIKQDGLKIRVGRWNIPGEPIVILVDFYKYFLEKNCLYGKFWEDYKVDSLHAYGDYDEASMFSYAAGKIVESYYRYNLNSKYNVVFQAHEWMTGLGALYIQKKVPQIATIFTTHATSIGRSIAGNNKPLYDYLSAYNGDQMARELNMESKHSIEKQTAHYVDCFTTVSQITNKECNALLEKKADAILMNGFEDDFVPVGDEFVIKRQIARRSMLNIANKLMGTNLDDNTLIVSTSGRYEFKNKGIDVFIEALNRLNHCEELDKNILAFITVPGWVASPREDLSERINEDTNFDTPLEMPYITHWLHNTSEDKVLGMFNHLDINNSKESRVKFIFVPCYLDGNDGIFNIPYYDIILGNDITIYPSYYEPWGYTPLESIAFHVPAITTDLAGFGLWANSLKGKSSELTDGVKVIHRSDYNYSEVADEIKNCLLEFVSLDENEVNKVRKNAADMAEKALWKHFIDNYYIAYDIAFKNANKRLLDNKIEYKS